MHVVNTLLVYIEDNFKGARQYCLTVKQAKEAVAYWVSVTPSLPAIPKIVAEKDFAGLCFHRLPFNFEREKKPTPIFDEFFSRCTNAKAIKAWIGSLLYDNASRQQYVWLHGEGGDGKGSLTRFLQAILGPSYASTVVPTGEAVLDL